MTSLWAILGLGLLLGVRHAFDADHLVAVTTIVSEYRNPLKAIWIGVSWGLGHTTSLLLAGILLLVLGVRLPENMALFFEFMVGVVLIILGVQTFWMLRHRRIHVHPHSSGEAHVHFHSHEENESHAHHSPTRNVLQFLVAGIVPGEHQRYAARGALKPFFRLKSYLVGTVHGLAGSATLMLLVLVNLGSTWTGVWYILVFGLGSVLSMGLVSIFVSTPFTLSRRLPRLNRVIQGAAGAFSIGFGAVLMYQVGVLHGLFLAS
ncbi:MAG: urease accessory protein UreH [Chloroflexi bacterium]|nr:urease accessory protein UreH [Chloroflexota bacterium]